MKLGFLVVYVATMVAAQSGPNPPVVFAPVDLYPMPATVVLSPSQRVGPATASLSSLSVSIGGTCSSAAINASALISRAFSSKSVISHPARSYPSSAYTAANAASCPTARQCVTDSDCGADTSCYTPPEQRWNSTLGCSPSPFVGKCGCCVPTSAPPALSHLVVTCDAASLLRSAESIKPESVADLTDTSTSSEAYTLTVNESTITITAAGPIGVARASTTLGQLLRWDFAKATHFVDWADVSIVDQPRFPFRSVMLDTSRHFIPVATILSVVDGAALGKFNVFHWHIVDSPSFPLESPTFPTLAKEGAFEPTATYSQSDIGHVVSHASSLGVDVVHGYVGNKAAVFPLQLLGFEVDFINSVQFSCHTGYPSFTGTRLEGDDLRTLVDGLTTNSLLTGTTHVLTGYIGRPSFGRAVVKVVEAVRAASPGAVFVCDPVLGDNGKLYVPEELVAVYRDDVLPLASIVTPNQFELELLTGISVVDEASCVAAMDALHDKGVQSVVVTSTHLPPDQDETMTVFGSTSWDSVASEADARWGDDAKPTAGSSHARFSLTIPRLSTHFTGTGDLTAALIAAWSSKCPTAFVSAVEHTIASVQAVCHRTARHVDAAGSAKTRELRIIQSKADIEAPVITIRARPLP